VVIISSSSEAISVEVNKLLMLLMALKLRRDFCFQELNFFLHLMLDELYAHAKPVMVGIFLPAKAF
jgi:hypothetical protein